MATQAQIKASQIYAFAIAQGITASRAYGVANNWLNTNHIPDITPQVAKSSYDAMVQKLTAAQQQISDQTAQIIDLNQQLVIAKAQAVIAPYKLNWPDRRPLGMLMRNGITDPTALIKHCNDATDIVVKAGGQGWIFWDAGTSAYDGDPRLSGIDLAAFDTLFAYAKSQGLVTGICLRADKVGTVYGIKNSDDAIAAQMIATAQFANQRWGCMVFYVDSNDTNNFTLQPRVNAALAPWLCVWENFGGTETDNAGALPATASAYVSADPRWVQSITDALRTGSLLVNFENPRTWFGVPTWAQGFRLIRMDRWLQDGVAGKDPITKQILMSATDYRAKFEKALGAELRDGGIPMFECWYPNGQMDEFKRLTALLPQ